MHWVLPHQPQNAIRYSIVLFRNHGDATEIFYHSDAATPELGDGEPPRRPLRVGHDCAGTNAPCQALQSLRVDFTEAFASDLDEFACQTIEANSRPLKFYRGKVDGDITICVVGLWCLWCLWRLDQGGRSMVSIVSAGLGLGVWGYGVCWVGPGWSGLRCLWCLG